MKKFVAKFAVLLIVCFAVIYGIYYLVSIYSGKEGSISVAIYELMDSAKQQNDCTVLYIGDSVCRQLWKIDARDPGVCHMGSNQAVTFAGTYIMVDTYLENNPQTTDVYLMFRPQSFANDLWLDFSYQYFVIPLFNKDNMKYLDQETIDAVNNKFGKVFASSELIKTVLANNYAFMDRYIDFIKADEEEKTQKVISPFTAKYLSKIIEVCDEKNVKLHIVAEPLADTDENHDWQQFNKDIIDYGFEDIMSGYIDDIDYYPEEWFRDGVHFDYDIEDEYGDEIRNKVLEGHN